MQRIERLWAVHVLRGDIALAERGHPQVNERVLKVRAAQPACLQQ